MILVLLLSALLVAWALHLMQQALDRQEFSLMLAGTLVASSAAALVVVYLLANSSLQYLLQVDRAAYGELYSMGNMNTEWLAPESIASLDQDQLSADWQRLVEPSPEP